MCILFNEICTNEEIPPKFIYIYIYIYIYTTLAKEFTAATRMMQSSSNELSSLVSGKVYKFKQNKIYGLMPYNSRADAVRLVDERYDN